MDINSIDIDSAPTVRSDWGRYLGIKEEYETSSIVKVSGGTDGQTGSLQTKLPKSQTTRGHLSISLTKGSRKE